MATTTHDTKRSEDVRARINVLSEVPQLWRKAVNRWARLNRRHHREVDGQPAPSRNDEYLFYQTLVGVWPLEALGDDGPLALRERARERASDVSRDASLPVSSALPPDFVDRIQQYMEKATREAKQRTSWISPNAGYDAAVREFVAAILDDRPKNRFLSEFRGFIDRLIDWGLYGSLGQTLLKLCSPGVPDVYQGQELWEFWLVDPDNRRPVDFALRRDLLARLQAETSAGAEARLALARHLAVHPRDARLKLLVTWQALHFRRQYAELFQRGQYEVLTAEGPAAEHVCALRLALDPLGRQA